MSRISTRRTRCLVFALALLLIAIAPAGGIATQERATAEDAKELVARAVALYEEAGREAAFEQIEDRDGPFVDHDLYVFVFGPERKIVAHGGDPELVGTPAAELEDVDGVPFGELFMDEAKKDGVWIDYKWRDPATGEVLPKRSWVVLHDGYVFGAGIYEPSDEHSSG